MAWSGLVDAWVCKFIRQRGHRTLYLHNFFSSVSHAFVLVMVSPVGVTLYHDDMFGEALQHVNQENKMWATSGRINHDREPMCHSCNVKDAKCWAIEFWLTVICFAEEDAKGFKVPSIRFLGAIICFCPVLHVDSMHCLTDTCSSPSLDWCWCLTENWWMAIVLGCFNRRV